MIRLLLVIALLSVSRINAQTLYLPGNLLYSGYWNQSIQQDITGGIVILGRFDDCDSNLSGFPFKVLNYTSKVYPLQPLNRWCSTVCTGYSCVMYPKGFISGYGYMPCGINESHVVQIRGYMQDEDDLDDWLLQTDPRWGNILYGQHGESRVRNYGCYITCCAMELCCWGLQTDPGKLTTYLRKQRDGFVGLNVNIFAVARYAKERGLPMRVLTNVSSKELISRGFPYHAKVNNRGHWVYVYGNYINENNYLIFDPMGRGVTSLVYDGISRNNTRTLYPKKDVYLVPVTPPGMTSLRSELGKTPLCKELPTPYDSRISFSSESSYEGSLVLHEVNNKVIALKDRRVVIAFSDEMGLDNAESGESSINEILEVSNINSGIYSIEVYGKRYSRYRIIGWQYISDKVIEREFIGTIPFSGVATMSIRY